MNQIPDPVVGKLLFQYQSRAFDVAWADFSLSVNAHTTSAFVKDLIKIKQPRGITDDDAAIELEVKMDGAVSGPVSGVVWNSSVEFEFDSDIGFVKMFDLLKLTIRGKDEKGKSVFKTLSEARRFRFFSFRHERQPGGHGDRRKRGIHLCAKTR